MKNAILTILCFFSLIFYAKGQLNYHVGFQSDFTDVRVAQWNFGYDFIRAQQLHFGIYSGFHLVYNRLNKEDERYIFYRFPIGFKYYFKTKQDAEVPSFFVGINCNVSAINYASSLIRVYGNNPDITNFGSGFTGGAKFLLPKQWEILIAGNYNFDFFSFYNGGEGGGDKIPFNDAGIFVSLGYNFNVTPNRTK